MQGPNGMLSILTIPPGAGPGLSQVQRIVIDGTRGAIFEYDTANNLVSSWASKAGTDPYGHTYPAGLQIQGSLIVSGNNGLFIYNGTPALGNPPVIWAAPPGVTTDPYGNTITGVFGAGSGTGAQLEVTQAGVEYLRNNSHNRVIALDPGREAIFIYSPQIGPGNLAMSMSPISGTDTQANTYDAGFVSYGATVFIQLLGSTLNWINNATPAFTHPQITAQDAPSGTSLNLNSGAATNTASASVITLDDSVLSAIPQGLASTNCPLSVGGWINIPVSIVPPTGTGPSLFGQNGILKFTDDNASTTFVTGRLNTHSATSQSITSTALTQVENMTAPVGARAYIIRGKVFGTMGATGSPVAFALVPAGGATVSFARIRWMTAIEQVGTVFTMGHWNAALGTAASGNIVASATFEIEFEGIIVLSAAGSISFQAAEGTAGDSWTVTGSYMTLENT